MTMIVQLLLSHRVYRAFSYYPLHLISKHGERFERTCLVEFAVKTENWRNLRRTYLKIRFGKNHASKT